MLCVCEMETPTNSCIGGSVPSNLFLFLFESRDKEIAKDRNSSDRKDYSNDDKRLSSKRVAAISDPNSKFYHHLPRKLSVHGAH